MKNKIIGCRVTDEDYNEMDKTRKVLKLKSMSELVLYLWDKFKRELKR